MQVKPKGMSVDGQFRGFVPRRRPLFGLWLKLLNAVVRLLTFGRARVVSVYDTVHCKNWDGIIR